MPADKERVQEETQEPFVDDRRVCEVVYGKVAGAGAEILCGLEECVPLFGDAADVDPVEVDAVGIDVLAGAGPNIIVGSEQENGGGELRGCPTEGKSALAL
ncbi:hypothetical protein [Pseudoflavonifractor phocaeensis]|uniref:hypothetical protein n=1 Tax=Pseudoflavonifractor phocaeensis TaxID=1870988 RepID=UPI0021086644|nr:hypothetical protein [Pseudoflavonifractor phocaeensis]MCQ4862659.1 hypothetical protein [Pseudoflavonifractor phocaeensis]